MNSASSWHATVLTLFPDLFPGPLGCSIIGRGLKEKIWSLDTVNLRDFAYDKHQSVDDIPFGGGPGMVLRPDVIDDALNHVCKADPKPDNILYLSPRGRPLQQNRVKDLARAKKIVMLCGRFEGIDQRVLSTWNIEEVSLGDFVLAGGEIAAMALIESCVRLLPGVIGDPDSLIEESFSHGLLEYPQYTRPREWREQAVPDVLTSGHHENIRRWRLLQSETITQRQRPDLWERYCKQKDIE